ncbi:hypothetical protein ANN_26856 [Periplaneta americana]|uniref:Uncharacterized protein n=1 Tax=Periplaneta americana TaxID=6978 RepID=A0ABQ8RZG3_PERAM|nr:hypothetical protein ANN_26856 [Periplaneta americana]
MIRRKNRKLSWLCDKCTDALTKVEKETGRKEDENGQRENITAKVDYIMDFLANELGPLIEDKINHSLTRKTEPSKRETVITNSNKKTASNESQHIYKDYEEHQRPAEERENTEKEEKEAGWKTQQPRERGSNHRQETQARTIIGTRNDSDDLQAAEKMAWLYIGRLKKSTTPETVAKYLERNGIQGNIICEELHNLGGKKAFKVGFPFNHIEETERSDFWPQGVIVRRFRFPKNNQDEGVELI